MKTSFFIGRWQVPELHDGHKALIQSAIDDGNRVVIGIRDTNLDEKNPYSLGQRFETIRRAFPGVTMVVIPDPDADLEICYGRGVGYTFREIRLSPELEAISGTEIREKKLLLWLTGNSGAGKTTLANGLKYHLNAVILDGDEMRESISINAGFSIPDRLEHNLRVARLAKTLLKQTNVIVSVIAPAPVIRSRIEEIVKPTWVYVKRNLPDNPERPYVPPENPDIVVDSDTMIPEESVRHVLGELGYGF